uniref:Uncharacterized protein n=1 Tax=Cannabis sativa TaxID=3483 RepID=A0A803NTE8_CANSA
MPYKPSGTTDATPANKWHLILATQDIARGGPWHRASSHFGNPSRNEWTNFAALYSVRASGGPFQARGLKGPQRVYPDGARKGSTPGYHSIPRVITGCQGVCTMLLGKYTL